MREKLSASMLSYLKEALKKESYTVDLEQCNTKAADCNIKKETRKITPLPHHPTTHPHTLSLSGIKWQVFSSPINDKCVSLLPNG